MNLVNKKWGDKNPPQTTQLNTKRKKEEIGNTVNNNNLQAGERGGGGKDFARDLTELMTRERTKNYWETSIYLLNPDTASPPHWLDLQYLVQPDPVSYHVSIMPCHKLHYV